MNALVLAFAMLALGTVEVVLLVLVVAVLIFGLGVLLVSRRRDRGGALPGASSTTLTRPPAGRAPEAPAADEGDTLVEEQELAEDERIEEIEEQLDGVDEAGALVIERPRFRDRLAKARASLAGAMTGVRSRAGITDDTWDELEEALLRADVGVKVTDELLGDLRARVKSKEISEPEQLLSALQDDMKAKLEGGDRELQLPPGPDGSPNVWLFVGVNGVGKTTTIGKVARPPGR